MLINDTLVYLTLIKMAGTYPVDNTYGGFVIIL